MNKFNRGKKLKIIVLYYTKNCLATTKILMNLVQQEYILIQTQFTEDALKFYVRITVTNYEWFYFLGYFVTDLSECVIIKQGNGGLLSWWIWKCHVLYLADTKSFALTPKNVPTTK